MTKSWFSARAVSRDIGEVRILEDIGAWGVTAKQFHQELTALGPVKTLEIIISSGGGEVTEGFAIMSMLARHPAKKIVQIDGLAASMASAIACVGDEVRISENAFIMIHDPWGGVIGDAEQMRKSADTLDMMRVNLVNTYAKRTGLDAARIEAMMAAETWLNAKEAVRLGFADKITPALKAAAMVKVGEMAARFKSSPLPRSWDAIRERAYANLNSRGRR